MFSLFSARVTPFKLSFVTDADEVTPNPEGTETTDESYSNFGWGGTRGFSLDFRQVPCA